MNHYQSSTKIIPPWYPGTTLLGVILMTRIELVGALLARRAQCVNHPRLPLVSSLTLHPSL